jgi:hypothetical protein
MSAGALAMTYRFFLLNRRSQWDEVDQQTYNNPPRFTKSKAEAKIIPGGRILVTLSVQDVPLGDLFDLLGLLQGDEDDDC